MARVDRIKVLQALARKHEEARRQGKARVKVGYTASYAVHVHEDLMMFHRNGQAKFLEQPLREMTTDGTLRRVVRKTMKATGDLVQSLLMAGLLLQRASQQLVPVRTGNLRASAFTRQVEET